MKKGSKIHDYLAYRKRAIELRKKGMKQQEIADVFGVGQSTVSNWLLEYKKKGEASLRYPQMGGSKGKLTGEEKKELSELLLKGSEHYGFEGDFWTRKRVGDVIKRHFGVEYKERSVGDVLKSIKYTLQKPNKKSYFRDEEKVKEWKEKKLPELKKKQEKKDM